MTINIKKHILFQLIVTILYILIWLIIKGFYISLLMVISYLVVLGIMNMIYINIVLFKQKYRYYLVTTFFSIIFIVYFWFLFIVITPVVGIVDFVSLVLKDSEFVFGLKRRKDWFVDGKEIELTQQENNLYNAFIKKYRIIYIMVIILIAFNILFTLLISRLVESDILAIIICIFIMLVELVVHEIIENLIVINAVKQIQGLLVNQCNSKSYCRILHNLENKYNQFTIAILYMNGLLYDGQNEQLLYLFDKYDAFKKNVSYKMLLFLYIEDNNKYFDELYLCLKKKYLKKVNNIKLQEQNKYNAQIIEVRMLMKNKCYNDALQILQSMDSKHKISKVNIEFKLGICLYNVGQIKDAKEKFLWVVENGDSLEYVDLAKGYLSVIK